MANEKKYLEVFNGGQDDLYIRDQEAHEELDNIPSIYATKSALTQATIIPIDIEEMTPGMTFEKNSILGINGVMYRAVRQTTDFPVVLLVEDGHIVYDEDEDGRMALVVEDWTLSEDWEIWTDASIPRTLQQMTADMENFKGDINDDIAAFKAEMEAIVGTSLKPSSQITSTSGQTYTVSQLLTALADLMEHTMVVNDEEE